MRRFIKRCLVMSLLLLAGCGTEVEEKDETKNGDGTADGVGGANVGNACKHIADLDELINDLD